MHCDAKAYICDVMQDTEQKRMIYTCYMLQISEKSTEISAEMSAAGFFFSFLFKRVLCV